MLKKLLVFTAFAEGAFGLLLILASALVVRLLIAPEISGFAITVARLTGVGLVALGVGCWPRGELRTERNVMLVWSVLAMVGLIVAGLRGAVGVLLWPAAATHGVIAVLLLRAGH